MRARGDADETIQTVVLEIVRLAFGGDLGPQAETDDGFAGASASETPRGAAVPQAALHYPDAPDERLDSMADAASAREVGDASRKPLRAAAAPFAPGLDDARLAFLTDSAKYSDMKRASTLHWQAGSSLTAQGSPTNVQGARQLRRAALPQTAGIRCRGAVPRSTNR